jgi:hypothetical protein
MKETHNGMITCIGGRNFNQKHCHCLSGDEEEWSCKILGFCSSGTTVEEFFTFSNPGVKVV